MQRVASVVAVLGAPLSGKGLLGHQWIGAPYTGLRLVCSPKEHSDNYAGRLGVRAVTSIPAMIDAIQGGARSAVLIPSFDDDLRKKQFDRFCRIASSCGRARVLVDELSRFTTASWAPTSWRDICTAGSHDALEVMGMAQRPALVDKSFLGSCTELRCYGLGYRSDAVAVTDVLIEVEWRELIALAPRHFVHLWKHPRRIERGIQPLPGERVTRRGARAPGPSRPAPKVTELDANIAGASRAAQKNLPPKSPKAP